MAHLPLPHLEGLPLLPPLEGPSLQELQLPPPVDILAKLGMKRKKKWVVEGQIKRTNWKAVPLNKLTEKGFWTSVDEEKMANPALLEDLQNRFSTKPAGKKVMEDSEGDTISKKKNKELKVLDAKAGQNLSVVLGESAMREIVFLTYHLYLGGALNHISHADVRRCIISCDTSVD